MTDSHVVQSSRYSISIFWQCLLLLGCFFASAQAQVNPALDSPRPIEDWYLAYKWEFIKSGEAHPCGVIPRKRMSVIDTASPGNGGRAVDAKNAIPGYADHPRLSIFSVPYWGIRELATHLEPKDYRVFTASDGTKLICLLGLNHDEVRISVVSPDGDTTRNASMTLATRPDSLEFDEWRMQPAIVGFEDWDLDSHVEVFIFLQAASHWRYLACVDIGSLEIEWMHPQSSPFGGMAPVFQADSIQPRMVYCSTNPSNGAVDDDFNDRYGYFTVRGRGGEIVVNRVVSTNFAVRAALTPAPAPQQYYVVHSVNIDADSIADLADTNLPSTSLLSIFDQDGNVLNSVSVPRRVEVLFTAPNPHTGKSRVYTIDSDSRLTAYDADLTNATFITDQPLGLLLERTALTGTDDSVLIFSYGITDLNFKLLATWPGEVTDVSVLSVDESGRAVDIACNNKGDFVVRRFIRKDIFDLTLVAYHRNESYVLAALSALVVGLILINIFRRRATANLEQIRIQKQHIEQAHAELDATHRTLRDTQAKLIEAEKFRQAKDIAGGFAHEIRNALLPAEGALLKIRNSSEGNQSPAVEKYATWTEEAVARALKLTRLVSTFTGLDVTLTHQVVNLTDLLNSVLRTNRYTIAEAGIDVTLDLPPDLAVAGDYEQLTIVFNNLVVNSLDALTNVSQPRILVTGRVQGSSCLVLLSDNGQGIQPENLGRIFDAFYSTKPTTGTGLGLAMVRKIIDVHRGNVIISSEVGHGTTVRVLLPLAETYSEKNET